jgi:basic membrane protein A
MRKLIWHLVTMTLAVILAACNTTPPPTPTVTPRSDYKLALILNAEGTIRDGTFNEAAYNGAQLAVRDYGLNFAYRETYEEKDYPVAIDDMNDTGRNIIITVGFQMQAATLAAAQKSPDVFFIGVDQAPENPPANLVGLLFRDDEAGFLAGALAGMMTKSNVVGVVGGVQIPPVERFVNGFVNGVKYINTNANPLAEYTTSFADGPQGIAKADAMIAGGADVIFGAGGLTGSSAIAYAASQGKFVIGVDQDEYRTTFKTGKDADRILTSAVKRVDTGVYRAIGNVLSGKFAGGLLVLGAAECGISYAPFHDAEKVIPAEVQQRLETVWRALAGGTLATGARDADAKTPEPLAAGAKPAVSDKAPKLSDCTL